MCDKKETTVKIPYTTLHHLECVLDMARELLEIKKEPRSLLEKMKVDYRDIEPSCCGGGGLLRMTDAGLSDIIINMRAASEGLKETTVLTCCPSCREQLMSNNLETKDIVELMAEVLDEGGD